MILYFCIYFPYYTRLYLVEFVFVLGFNNEGGEGSGCQAFAIVAFFKEIEEDTGSEAETMPTGDTSFLLRCSLLWQLIVWNLKASTRRCMIDGPAFISTVASQPFLTVKLIKQL